MTEAAFRCAIDGLIYEARIKAHEAIDRLDALDTQGADTGDIHRLAHAIQDLNSAISRMERNREGQ